MANPMIRAMMPTAEQMKAGNEATGHKRMGFHWMFENNEENWIKAFFGSREKQAAIPSVAEGYRLYRPDDQHPTYLDHGYDEKKGMENLTKEDLDKAAAFRGGECLEDHGGDIYKPIRWKCAADHVFKMSVNAVLGGGHWCPECLSHEWNYAEMAQENPFFAQVWNPQHDPDDNYCIKMAYSAYDIKKELEEKLKGE